MVTREGIRSRLPCRLGTQKLWMTSFDVPRIMHGPADRNVDFVGGDDDAAGVIVGIADVPPPLIAGDFDGQGVLFECLRSGDRLAGETLEMRRPNRMTTVAMVARGHVRVSLASVASEGLWVCSSGSCSIPRCVRVSAHSAKAMTITKIAPSSQKKNHQKSCDFAGLPCRRIHCRLVAYRASAEAQSESDGITQRIRIIAAAPCALVLNGSVGSMVSDRAEVAAFGSFPFIETNIGHDLPDLVFGNAATPGGHAVGPPFHDSVEKIRPARRRRSSSA